MRKTQPLVTFSLAFLCAFAQAEDIRPGLWKISMESGVKATPDWKPQPFETTQCLTENDAKNPAGLLLGMGSPGATGCDFVNTQYAGDSLSFEVSCGGTLGIKGHGVVTYSATSVDGFLDVSMGENEKVDMQNKLHASYLGTCPAAGAPPAALPRP